MRFNALSDSKAIVLASFIGFLASAAAIIFVPVFLSESSSRSPFFWQRIFWSEFLAILGWSYLGGFFSLILPKSRSVRGIGAVLPALGVLIFFYVTSSFALMMIAAYFPQFTSVNLASQVYRAAGLVIIIVFLFFSWITGISDSEPVPEMLHSPPDLASQLEERERLLHSRMKSHSLASEVASGHGELLTAIRRLREHIQYSIPHAGSIGKSAAYAEFSRTVDSLCQDLAEVDYSAAETLEAKRITERIDTIDASLLNISRNQHR